MSHAEDTIAAIATARGIGALAIVRMSGSRAIAIAAKHFGPSDLSIKPTHTVTVGFFRDAEGSELDHVVATVFRAPSSVTGEDVVELSCHGGDIVSRLVLDTLVASGARPADPGEFTLRAFLNGKIDLAQAEAVADLIHAGSTVAQRVSVSQIKGRYSEHLRRMRSELVEMLALVELELDFGEEDVEFADRTKLRALLDDAGDLLRRLTQSYRLGEVIRDGVRVVIAGKPNAGKSTLLNALLGYDRAIVSEHPGTTRDEIEAEAEIGGIRYRFVDTAGIRETLNDIEAEGVRRTHAAIGGADLVVYVYDALLGLEEEEQSLLKEMGAVATAKLVVVANKQDLIGSLNGIPPAHIPLSATEAIVDERLLTRLVDTLGQVVAGDLSVADVSRVVVNRRHQHHLTRALEALNRCSQKLDAGGGGELLSADLRTALTEIGAITGEFTNEEVLDEIFSKFCIGK